MSPRPSSTTRELIALYSRAGRDEFNLGAFLRERPELVAQLGPIELDRDDADLALQLASAIGRYKRAAARELAGDRAARAERAAGDLAASARHRFDRIELEPDVLLGDLLAGSQKYISLELAGARVAILRHRLLRARVALRAVLDVVAFVDERGLHLRWRAARGGLNLTPQVEDRGALALVVDLRPKRAVRRARPVPVLLAEVLADLGLV